MVICLLIIWLIVFFLVYGSFKGDISRARRLRFAKSCSNFSDNDTSSNGGKKQPTKWKPLILETPSKRERERRAHQQQ
jgi:hypothetical protein